jgi:fructose-bisphosphate aldolase class II
MDGSLKEDGRTPSSFEYNVQVTREVVDMAHAVGVTVEGELGRIGGVEDGHGSGRGSLTDPHQAVEFFERTGVDALAVAIGTSHGASKFSRPPDHGILAMDLIAQIHELLPDVHLVMHGASSLPQDLVADINAHGGQVTPSWGVPVAEMQAGIRMGVRKINTDTDLRLAMTAGIRRTLEGNPALIDPRAYLGEARSAMTALVAQRMRDVGQAGHGGDIEPVPLAEMRRRYAAAGVSRT